MRRAALAVVVALAAACSSSPADEEAAPTTRPAETTITAPAPAPTTSTTEQVVARPAEDPVTLAEQLVAAERGITDPATPVADLPNLGHAVQVAYRQLVAHPEWQETVYSRLSPEVANVTRAHVAAGAALRSLVTQLKDAPPPDWQIVDPPPAEQLLSFYADGERQTGIPWYYLASIHLVETRMGRLKGVSTAQAKGPMQFIDSTWARHGVDATGDGVADVNDPHDAIVSAARYLVAAGGPANMARAVFAYNHAQTYVDAVTTYAEHMRADARRYHAYYGWQVYYITTQGDVLLPVGYGSGNTATPTG